MASTICVTNLDTMLEKIAHRTQWLSFIIFHHISLSWYESHILHSWQGESSTVAREDYIEFLSLAVKLNEWQVETVI